MKNVTIIVLAVLLAAAVISGVLLRGKYLDMKDTLSVCNKEKSEVYDQVKKNAEEIRKLQEGSKGEKKIGESLRRELSSREGMVTGLKEQLQMEKSVTKAKIEELKSTYDSELRSRLKSKEMTIREFEEKVSITFVDRVLFDFGEATITPEGRSILRRVGKILKNVQGMQIRVVGHTDNRPIRKEYQHKFPSNWELSAARAAAVARYFQGETGLDPKSLEIAGRSFYRPVASNETEEGRAQNRRVEVIIAPKIER
jgi:chemotaxis protein MotB